MHRAWNIFCLMCVPYATFGRLYSNCIYRLFQLARVVSIHNVSYACLPPAVYLTWGWKCALIDFNALISFPIAQLMLWKQLCPSVKLFQTVFMSSTMLWISAVLRWLILITKSKYTQNHRTTQYLIQCLTLLLITHKCQWRIICEGPCK